jgi:hypothetical protein
MTTPTVSSFKFQEAVVGSLFRSGTGGITMRAGLIEGNVKAAWCPVTLVRNMAHAGLHKLGSLIIPNMTVWRSLRWDELTTTAVVFETFAMKEISQVDIS